jgi:hypothetical protein
MFDELTEGMDLKDLKKLLKLMPSDYRLSARILNMLWINFSHDQFASEMVVDRETVDRFIKWIETGDPDEAIS